jgi:ribulose-phosphate 3-epimerase
MKVVPAILAETFDDFTVRLREAESFTDYVQIDIMDGAFVGTTSFPVERINGVSTTLSFEAHLMVNEPVSFMDRITHPGLRKVIFHFETSAEFPSLIRRIRGRGLVPGLAVKPETGLDAFRGIAEQVDALLFLTVDPGFYGNSFRPEVLTKIAEARKVFPSKVMAADGGISLENLERFLDIGVDYVCVGSRIFMGGHPGENYLRFVDRVKEIRKG